MIHLQNVNKTYVNAQGKSFAALDAINLRVERGEIYGVIGKSGAGKSTLIRCVNLLEQPTSGKIIVDNQDLLSLSTKALRQARYHMGMIFQHFNLLQSKTVYENIAFPLRLARHSRQDIETTVMSLLELVDMQDKKNSYPSQLSGGQKQRVAIARALANKPKVLLCDEATSALDPQTTKTILKLLKDINQQFQLTILLITHEMDVVKQICHRVALIDKGHIIENAKIIDFFTNPQTDVAKHLVENAIRKDIPSALKKKIESKSPNHKNPLIRIYFHGEATSEPLIAHLIKNIGIDINILQADVEMIADETIGTMTVEVVDHNGKFNAAMAFLQSKRMKVEVLGYV